MRNTGYARMTKNIIETNILDTIAYKLKRGKVISYRLSSVK